MKIARRAAEGLAMAAVLAVLLSGCLARSVTVSVTLDDSGAIKSAHVGDRLVVRLEGNPSTGFTWNRVAPSDDALLTSPLEVVEEGTWEFPAGENVPGSPGLCVFDYEIIRTGIVTLSYAYARSWEGEPAETFTVTIWATESQR